MMTIENLDSSTVRLGSINATTGVVSNIGNSEYNIPINLTGATIDPYSNHYYIGSGTNFATFDINSGNLINNVQILPFSNDPSIYNGSVRLLWAAPNYGYFNNLQVVKPQPDSYINEILTGNTKQSSFKLLLENNYSNIEEIFSVFDKGILDKFEQEFLNFST
jgi:hypothetical protein